MLILSIEPEALMTDEPVNDDPVAKFRKLIANFIPLIRLSKKAHVDVDEAAEPKTEIAKKEEVKQVKNTSAAKKKESGNVISALPKRTAASSEILGSLPKKSDADQQQPAAVEPGDTPASQVSKPGLIALPFLKKKSAKPGAVAAPATASKSDQKPESASNNGYPAWGPRLWTFASILSLTINIILTIVIIILMISVYRLNLDVSYVLAVGKDLVGLPGGLYSNFEKMERASIQTNVVVDTTIPVKFDLLLNQQTNVVLSQDVTITNALVTVNTGGLNIARANTTIVLPQGTTLPVLLNLTVPVDQQVPVTLNVPVNIALRDTQLNEPFVGLQNVIKPLYCFLTPQAVNMDGQPICQ